MPILLALIGAVVVLAITRKEKTVAVRWTRLRDRRVDPRNLASDSGCDLVRALLRGIAPTNPAMANANLRAVAESEGLEDVATAYSHP